MVSYRHTRVSDYALLIFGSMLAFLPFLGASPLFDWDEINFAESAREMIASGNYFQVQIDFEPFWEKPPLFIWMQVLCMKIFGINEFAARLPNAITGIFTISLLYKFGSQIVNRFFGLLSAGFYFVSLLPFLYFKSGIIDPVFNLFIFLGLAQVIRFELTKDKRNFSSSGSMINPVLAGLFIGLATLTKGPVALLISGLTYLIATAILNRFRFNFKVIFIFIFVFLIVILSWFGAIILLTEDGWEIIQKFIYYQVELFSEPVAGHQQPFYYHFLIFTFGCFPLSAFAFRGMFNKMRNNPESVIKLYMLIWFWVVMIIFSIVKTKIVHYSSMLYFPGAFLAALWLMQQRRKAYKLKWDIWVLLVLPMSVVGIAASLINIAVNNFQRIVPLIKDDFAVANLTADVHWSGFEWIPGFLFLIGSSVAIYYLVKQLPLRYLLIQGITMVIFLNGLNWLVVPGISGYTQKAAVDYFKLHSKEDAYLMVAGYKSYVHYYYGEIKPFAHTEISVDERNEWLRNGNIDKPVYMATKNVKVNDEFLAAYSKFEMTGEKAGFVFFKRLPESNSSSIE